MTVPAVVMVKNRDNIGSILQIILYFLAFIMIIYTLYKLFGMFKDWGEKIEKKLKQAGEYLNPSDFSEKAKTNVEATKTIIKGVLEGKTDSPEYNEAMNILHYGGDEWTPGTAPPVNPNNPVLGRYGQQVKPGESKTFHGGYYTETDVNNMVKDPWGGYATREDALAHKYGFVSYANFKAWLEGVKAALKAEGKDPNAMTLDQLVKYGRELERKKREWEKQNPEKATPTLDVWKPDVPDHLKPYEADDELYRKLNDWITGGRTEVIPKRKDLPKPIPLPKPRTPEPIAIPI
ncbi:hypothetical membrane protein [Thermococcus kodakarensis KOD1]|uniref:Hypothetical membrane protein n=1 Tax=Thermococcus kodakarensis (strain ATCC BAA-918 / JCM 12380 / KOD1) TaxID=69014 RepID=Q5JGX1_THEKO|nr:hypothetical protein [Thermococcus kodakarensis]WCN27330.1 hypothetical protein POG15_06865 [Thermococcus kodakarensis]WCN29619.1 hypothetical protein POG21_06860 [Thermococcus kodakarensis]BAD85540.1 hypothetical membrane protein [Thermococcus kodakarensis KOD1]